MKKIPGNVESAQWDDDFLQDISYIKKHLRYRPKKSTLMPVVFWGVFIILLMTLLFFSIYEKVTGGIKIPFINVLMAASSLFLFTINIVRYVYSLKFISINTGKYVKENMQLIDSFLLAEHLLTFRHDDIPELFQIQSRNLSAGKEDREVILFIADDQRILINSHFTNGGWGISPAKRHHKQMADMLKKYIDNSPKSNTIVHNTF